jgi:multicomponent Na+:H+ antiporter subunit B
VKARLVGALLMALGIPMLAAVAALPQHGDPEAPIHTHVAARYVAVGAEETGAPNLVTGVLLNYRGLDTFGEVVVIFTALAAALAVLLASAAPVGGRPGDGRTAQTGAKAEDRTRVREEGQVQSRGGEVAGPDLDRVPPSPVVAFIVRLVAPFIAMFGVFVILTGHVTPGGGLQGAAILGSLFIVLALVLGPERARRLLPCRSRPWLEAAGPLAFFVVGLLGALLTGHALGYPLDPALHLVRELMLMGVEVGIGVGGAMIFAALYLALEGL